MDARLWELKQWGEDCSYQMWTPQCDTSGAYSAVQIKSNSVQDHAPYRWCSAPSGQRLHGREKDRSTGETDMTCACSVKRWELEQRKVDAQKTVTFLNILFIQTLSDPDALQIPLTIEAREDVTLHCTELGNYERLQCDKGLCWCVEER